MLNDSNPPSNDPRTFAIIGAAYEVHRVLGTGFLEVFYKDALEIEFIERRIPYQREVPCSVEYKGRSLSRNYQIDFLCFDAVVLEIKARSVTRPAEHAQLISYLASVKKRHGLLINFGAARLEHRRFAWDPRV
jgi:GxxExxY protein